MTSIEFDDGSRINTVKYDDENFIRITFYGTDVWSAPTFKLNKEDLSRMERFISNLKEKLEDESND